MIDEEVFLSGGDAGAISLWSVNRKKPLFTKLNAHGPKAPFPSHFTAPSPPSVSAESDPAPAPAPQEGSNWITSLATVRYTDVFASGAGDGYIRVWKLADNKKMFGILNVIPMPGFINSLQFFEASPLPESSPSADSSSEEVAEEEGLTERAKQILKRAGKETKGDTELFLAGGVGQEHRLGRWWRCKGVRNGVRVVRFG
ncbi:pre-rRNA processing protein [Rhizophlyctis rosea]|uniref:Pre-rRNA processing protein n=1 Tax=Rhizophlyctis rosea TaxID=64517 RepID=A0AAD5S1Z7_9FUNG|nr:pre-rRNA processing protein [Rhizophlyctis rosea]